MSEAETKSEAESCKSNNELIIENQGVSCDKTKTHVRENDQRNSLSVKETLENKGLVDIKERLKRTKNKEGSFIAMSEDERLGVINCFMSLRLAVAVAVIKMKPGDDISGEEYAKQLYTIVNDKSKREENQKVEALLESLASTTITPTVLSHEITARENVGSSGQMRAVMAIASLNKLNNLLTSSDQHPSEISVSIASIEEQVEEVFFKTRQHLVLNDSGSVAKSGLTQVACLASQLERLCLLDSDDSRSGLYRALSNCILYKTSELCGHVQQFIVEATEFSDYAKIAVHVETLLMLTCSASIFVTIVKMMLDLVDAVLNQFLSASDSQEGSVDKLFTNSGYLLQALENLFHQQADIVADLRQREEREEASKKRKVEMSCCEQTALVLQGDGTFMAQVDANLTSLVELMESRPLFVAFLLKCKSEFERLSRLVDGITNA